MDTRADYLELPWAAVERFKKKKKTREASLKVLLSCCTLCSSWRSMSASCCRRVKGTVQRHDYHNFKSKMWSFFASSSHAKLSSAEVWAAAAEDDLVGVQSNGINWNQDVTLISPQKGFIKDCCRCGVHFPLWLVDTRGGGGWIIPLFIQIYTDIISALWTQCLLHFRDCRHLKLINTQT